MDQVSLKRSSLTNSSAFKIILALAGIFMAGIGSTMAQDYPPSPVIERIIIENKRMISFGDGDNFPVTWADDGKLYTMYCDGAGFDDIPIDQWKSNGFAELICTPFAIKGKNIPSPDIEFDGSGRSGRKASGLVCIKGVLYSLVRNLNTDGTGMSLFWSADKGKTWTEAEWGWPEIGLADWLNMGQDYTENRDGYAYFIAHAGNDAYEIYDGFIMARVRIDSILDKNAYWYFSGWNGGTPAWSPNFSDRKPVFEAPGRCYRPCIVYNPGINRYLLFTIPWRSKGEFFERYIGIFDAPNPWGPWTIADEITDFTEERYHPRVPSKWISSDGLSFGFNYSVLSKNLGKSRYRYNLEEAHIILRDPAGNSR
jgi:hypothetical protein